MPPIPKKMSILPTLTPKNCWADPTPGMTPWQAHVHHWKGGCGAPECARALHVVLARGSVPCDVLFVGEAPGASENILAEPFRGPAGELLQRIIDKGLPRGVRYAITNMVGCIPTDVEGAKSGEPDDAQVRHCRPRLEEFAAMCNPRLVVLVGKTAQDHCDRKYLHRVELPDVPQLGLTHPSAIMRMKVVQREHIIRQSVIKLRNAVEAAGIEAPADGAP